ncbi:MAG: hypothetical protein LBE83_06780 [Propionibacteriaceae bacterium]|jgi:uncharacterized lipoprotein NlpE involved in copper resistance|nr:hypothetical protein [Propionibacteriaceae bacterium]
MLKRSLATLSALILALTLVGCGSGSKSNDLADNFIGEWKAITVETNGEAVDLSVLEALGMSFKLTLDAKMTYKFDVLDEVKEGTWTVKNATTGTITIDGEKVDLVLANGQLTLRTGGNKIVFERS